MMSEKQSDLDWLVEWLEDLSECSFAPLGFSRRLHNEEAFTEARERIGQVKRQLEDSLRSRCDCDFQNGEQSQTCPWHGELAVENTALRQRVKDLEHQYVPVQRDGEKWWGCLIGPAKAGELPPGCDAPMRHAVEGIFYAITGHEDKFLSSGWGAHPDAGMREIMDEPPADAEGGGPTGKPPIFEGGKW